MRLPGTLLLLALVPLAHSEPASDLLASFPATLDGLSSSSPIAAPPLYVVIEPSDEVTFSSETTASIANIKVKEGSQFQTGDLLLEMDCRIQQADFDKAVAQQKLADIALESAKKLKSYDSISAFELAQAVSQAESARADASKLQAIVEKCQIKAPFSGSVANLFVRAKETVKPGDPLLKIVSTENLDFTTQVPSNWLAWLHIGSTFNVLVSETKKTIPVRVIRINPEINSVSQTVRITGKTIQPDPTISPGMSGQATFPDLPTSNGKSTK